MIERTVMAIALAAMIATAAAADVTLVRDGQATAIIVVPDNAPQAVGFGARELQHHVAKATGATLEIFKQSEAPNQPAARVCIGACAETIAAGVDPAALEPDGFTIKVTGDLVLVTGRDANGYELYGGNAAGSLFAVHALLDRFMGVRWLWPGEVGEVVPETATITIPETELTVEPRMQQRMLRSAMASFAKSGGADLMTDEQLSKVRMDERVWLRRQRMGWPKYIHHGHAFSGYWERFGETHPEFFNLLPNGKREPLVHQKYISMCVSQPALWQQIVDDWQARREEKPGAFLNLNCCENDTDGLCTCERCMAWDVPNPTDDIDFENRLEVMAGNFETMAGGDYRWRSGIGTVSDRYARFYLEVQKLAREIDPDAMVCGYAYGNYRKPPLATKLNENIVLAYVPRVRYPEPEDVLASRRDEWMAWRETGARLMLRPNSFLAGFSMPYIFAEQFGRQFKFALENGMIGTDFDSLTGMWGAQAPNLYMLGRLHARPDLTPDEVMAEFYAAFGAGGPRVREYFDYWAGISADIRPKLDGLAWHGLAGIIHEVYTAEMFAEGARLLAEARRATGADAATTARVEFLGKGLENARLTWEMARVFAREDSTVAEQVRAGAELDVFRAEIMTDNAVNVVVANWTEKRYWPRWPTAMLRGKRIVDSLPITWKLKWDPDEVGTDEQWFADDLDTAEWLSVATDRAWEKQPVGEQWRAAHGKHYDGLAWYRTQFTLPAELAGQQVWLAFGAVDEGATVWVNGQLAGEHPFVEPDDWTTPFLMDIKPMARYDGPNTVTVLVEDRTGAGGVWRPVLIVAGE